MRRTATVLRFTSTRRLVTTVYICNKIAVYIRVDAGSMPSARGDCSFFLLAQIKKIRALLLIFYRDLDMACVSTFVGIASGIDSVINACGCVLGRPKSKVPSANFSLSMMSQC